MKRVLVALIALMATMSTTVVAQDQEGSKSVAFMSKNGSLIQKEFHDVAKVKTMEFQVLILTNIVSSAKIGCLRAEASYGSDSYIGTLDYDELDACIQSIDYIKDKLLPTEPTVYTEVEYRTSDGVSLGAYFSKKWTVYFRAKGRDYRSQIYLDAETLESLKTTMLTAKDKIAQLSK